MPDVRVVDLKRRSPEEQIEFLHLKVAELISECGQLRRALAEQAPALLREAAELVGPDSLCSMAEENWRTVCANELSRKAEALERGE